MLHLLSDLLLERGQLGCDVIPSSEFRGKWNAAQISMPKDWRLKLVKSSTGMKQIPGAYCIKEKLHPKLTPGSQTAAVHKYMMLICTTTQNVELDIYFLKT